MTLESIVPELAAEYKSWAAKAVKEADELRARIAELEAALTEAINEQCSECDDMECEDGGNCHVQKWTDALNKKKKGGVNLLNSKLNT
jgi:hypothetical protein